MRALLDDGSNANLIGSPLAQKLKLKLGKSAIKCTSDGQTTTHALKRNLRIRFHDDAVFNIKDFTYINPLPVSPDDKYDLILGERFLQSINAITDHGKGTISINNTDTISINSIQIQSHSDEKNAFTNEILQKYSSVIAKNSYDVGRCDIEAPKQFLRQDLSIPNLPMYNIPVRLRDEAESIAQSLCNAGVLTKGLNSISHPVLLTRKKNGTFRFITDLRKINAITVKIEFNPPVTHQLLMEIGPFHFISTVDVANAFYAIPLHKENLGMFGVRVNNTNYTFQRLPQGAKNSGSIFQYIIQQLTPEILHGCPNSKFVAYIDDCIITTQGPIDEHKRAIINFFESLQRHGLKVAKQKIHLLGTNANCLGFNINKIVGNKSDPVLWDDVSNNSYERLIKDITQNKPLSFPNLQIPFTLRTDACASGIGGILLQICDNKETIIGFFHRQLPKVSKQRCTTYLELLSIVQCLRFFRNILTGSTVFIQTDHLPLTRMKSDIPKYVELYTEISQFDAVLQFLPGSQNIGADFLSRLYNNNICISDTNEVIKQLNEAISEYNNGIFTLKSGFQDIKNTILHMTHLELGHASSTILHKTITKRITWDGIGDDIKMLLQRCKECIEHNPKYSTGHDISMAYHKGLFALDVCGPIDHSNKKVHFLLSVHLATHFTTLEPLFNTREESVIAAMKEAFRRHKPTKIRMDNATYFKGSKVTSFLTKEGIEHDYNTPNNHTGNCYAERFIGKALLTLRKLYNQQESWSNIIKKTQLAINIAEETKNLSPFEQEYGYPPALGIDLIINNISDAELYEKPIQFQEPLPIYIRNPVTFKGKPRFIGPFLATKFNSQRKVIYFKKSPNGKMLARNINDVKPGNDEAQRQIHQLLKKERNE